MASQQDADQAIIDRVAELAPKANTYELLRLAEATAWVQAPSQPHGGSNARPAGR